MVIGWSKLVCEKDLLTPLANFSFDYAMMVHNMEGDFRQRPASKRAPHFCSPQSSKRNSNVQGYEKSVKVAMKSIKPMVPLNGVDGKELVGTTGTFPDNTYFYLLL